MLCIKPKFKKNKKIFEIKNTNINIWNIQIYFWEFEKYKL